MHIPQCAPPVALPPLGAESALLSLRGGGGHGGTHLCPPAPLSSGDPQAALRCAQPAGGVCPLGHVCVRDLGLSVQSRGEQRPLWGAGEWPGAPTPFFRAQVLE